MSVRAGIVVTGTEVLTGRVADENGPWLADRLLDLGVELAHITICGDRPDDLLAQLHFLADTHVDLIITSGGLGPTADDLTVATVAQFCGRELMVDPDLHARITAIIRAWATRRGSDPDVDAISDAIGKQATIPVGAEWVAPTGTAPGVVVAGDGTPTVLVLPGPPRELQAMWPAAVATTAVRRAITGHAEYRQQTLRMYGVVEAELAESLRAAEHDVDGFDALEITTCQRRGEVEMVTRFEPSSAAANDAVVALLTDQYTDRIFSTDGATVDHQVAALLAGKQVATAESCTAGLVAARLTDLAGSSAYVAGGVVAYADEVKVRLLGVDPALIATHGAVSEPVAEAMARGARERFDADIAVSTSGIAGPGGGTRDKPVGTVCFGIALADGTTRAVTRRIPGDRADVRDRSTTVALHLLRRALLGNRG
ncbi:competence/damage-inducible protein A [Williamsia sterculiae]|uniref:CinA-like protein n=1 Tax=Williamsia sterculiae TaxID=1344003 RepID=A0A1N7GRG0_9NOCA|nr:competence/damage-inducible protein A [Williamsia sterculiae]SIS15154.1 competence/damage-inducible protein cinA [Williamsia sterculiae]